MLRREIVLLVSRAIAIFQIITAVMDAVFSLPSQAFLLSRSLRVQEQLLSLPHPLPRGAAYTAWISEMSVILTLGRIAVLLFIAYLFWNCGPTIEHWLLPSGSEEPEPVKAI